ncbi:hypothetical protein Q4516_00340 [Mesomycoplasma ovipneumoniae]|uniref:hypothetical protein n=1 Tax=Mesomycoplasma ovipneumoniae TaxID=29562 RepID=UPI0026E3D354|nr:hypothetical protein [Mesomycoplasma ovipneumoniae]MDO6825748.1 hypothetical protein [Mesomycoplasma ovipneumoniae]MDO6856671.1 hypothetical protein [Mesomycoplasma ovipneumoniae]
MSLKNIYIESCFSDLIRLASKNRFLMRRYVHSINTGSRITGSRKMGTITVPNVEIFNQNVGSSRRKWLKHRKIAKKRKIQIDKI